MIRIFPTVTYNKKDVIIDRLEDCYIDKYQEIFQEMSEDAIYSSLGGGTIWLRKPSIKWLIHEYLHHIGYSLDLPLFFHRLIHKIF